MAKEFVRVEGLENVEKMLISLGAVSGFKALRSGLMAASKPMLVAAKANAVSVGKTADASGAIATAMSRAVRKDTKHKTTLWIGPRNKNKRAVAQYNDFHHTDHKRLNYFHLVEWGSVHGNAQPFMRPAFAATSVLVVSNLGKEIKKAVDKIKRKYATQ